jgi:hypothetical protein
VFGHMIPALVLDNPDFRTREMDLLLPGLINSFLRFVATLAQLHLATLPHAAWESGSRGALIP